MAESSLLRGYGQARALMFSGNPDDFELWSVKFKGYLRIQKLHTVLETPAEGDSDKNAEIFAYMVQFLDDKSISLIMRDAPDDGRKAYKILKNHYLGSSKPRIISLYTELTSLKMGGSEAVTEYVLRAETAASRLKDAGETISDHLLIAMVLKGLPNSFKAFTTIISNTDDKMEFSKFKIALRTYEENEAARIAHNTPANDEVYKVQTCFNCGEPGHRQAQCTNRNSSTKKGNKPKRWCDYCKAHSHDTNFCRRKGRRNQANAIKSSHEEDKSFIFKISTLNKVKGKIFLL